MKMREKTEAGEKEERKTKRVELGDKEEKSKSNIVELKFRQVMSVR